MRVALVLIASLLAPSVAVACSCDDPPAPLDALDAADAVVEVTLATKVSEPVVETSEGDDDDEVYEKHLYDLVTYTFEVDVSWKGELAVGDTITLANSTECCVCERSYGNVGTPYLLYLRETADGFSDGGICSRTTRLDDAACDLEEFETGLPWGPAVSDGCATAGGGRGRLAAALLVVLVGSTRRRRAISPPQEDA